MITSKHHHLRLLQHWGGAAQNLADLQRQVFDAAQRAQGLGLVVQYGLQGLGQSGGVDVSQLGNGGVHGVGGFYKKYQEAGALTPAQLLQGCAAEAGCPAGSIKGIRLGDKTLSNCTGKALVKS